MARRPRAGEYGDRNDDDPTQQLAAWREWRHDDTAELPALERPDAEHGAVPAEEDLETRRRRRPGAGVLIGASLLAVAVVLSVLAATGVGPVRDLLGFSDSGGAGSGSSTAPTASASVSQPSSGTASTSVRGAGGADGSGGSSAARPSGAPSGRAQVPGASGGPAVGPKGDRGAAPRPGQRGKRGPAAPPSGAPAAPQPLN